MDIAGNRRQSLPVRSQPRPSRLSLAPSKGILKRHDDDNNTVIGVMGMAGGRRNTSIPNNNRRVSFAPEKTNIWATETFEVKFEHDNESDSEPNLRRSPRLASKRAASPTREGFGSTGSPSSRSPSKKRRKSGPSPVRSVPSNTADNVLIELDDDNTTSMEFTLPFTIRADQIPLKPSKNKPNDSFALKSNASDLENPKVSTLKSVPFPQLTPEAQENDKENRIGNASMPTSWSSVSMLTPILASPAWPSTLAGIDGMDMEFTRPLRSPKKKLLQRITSMSPNKAKADLLSPGGIFSDAESEATGPIGTILSTANDVFTNDDDSGMELTRPLSAIGENDSGMELTKPSINNYNDDNRMELTQPIIRENNNSSRVEPTRSLTTTNDEDSGMELTRPFASIDRDDSGMELTRPFTNIQNSKWEFGDQDGDTMEFTAIQSKSRNLQEMLHDRAKEDNLEPLDEDNQSEEDMEMTVKLNASSAGNILRQTETIVASKAMSTAGSSDRQPTDNLHVALSEKKVPSHPHQLPNIDNGEAFESEDDMDLTRSSRPANDAHPDLQIGGDDSDMELTRPISSFRTQKSTWGPIAASSDDQDEAVRSPAARASDSDDDMEITRPVMMASRETQANHFLQKTSTAIAEKEDLQAVSMERLSTTQVFDTYNKLIDLDDDEVQHTSHTHTQTKTISHPGLVARTHDIVRARTISDTGYRNITVSEFLSKVNISFMDDFLVDRRSHSSVGLTNSSDEGNSDLTDYVIAIAAEMPLLKMFEFACRELKADHETVKESFSQWEKETALDNPVLFQEYMEASSTTKQIMNSQFQLLKSYSREEAKGSWYQWRYQLTKGLKKDLERNAAKLRKALDSGIGVQLQQAVLEEEKDRNKISDLQNKIKATEKRNAELRKLRDENRSGEKEAHKLLKQEVKTVKEDVRASQTKLEAATTQAEELVSDISRMLKDKDALLGEVIPQLETQKRNLQLIDDADVAKSKCSTRDILQLTLWRSAEFDLLNSALKLYFHDDSLTVRLCRGSLRVNISSKVQTHPIRHHLLKQLADEFSQDQDLTEGLHISKRLFEISNRWLEIEDFCNKLDRFCVTFDTVARMRGNEIILDIQLTDSEGKVQNVSAQSDLRNLSKSSYRCTGAIILTNTTIELLTKQCLSLLDNKKWNREAAAVSAR